MNASENDSRQLWALASIREQAELDRFHAQAAFADWLTARHPNRAARGTRLVARARERVAQAAGQGVEAKRSRTGPLASTPRKTLPAFSCRNGLHESALPIHTKYQSIPTYH